MTSRKKYFFASDFHLGIPNQKESLKREKRIVSWLNRIQDEAKDIFLVGDLFDFWFEYKFAVPKGYTRFLGKLAELSDNGIKISIFTGNHDLWMRDYFKEELQIDVFHHPVRIELYGKKFLIGHGDGLGPGDHRFKLMKKVFVHPLSKWLYRQLHPDIGIRIASFFSRRSRLAQNIEQTEKFLGEENEWLIQYAKRILQKEKIDYFVFGHRHLPLQLNLNDGATYVNLGDWLNYDTYASFDGNQIQLLSHSHPDVDYTFRPGNFKSK